MPRLLEHLGVPRKGLIRPWAHAYPHFAKPGPQVGFLQEILRWWDFWLKGQETGYSDYNDLVVGPTSPELMATAGWRRSADVIQ